jgi:hypothetical protein
MDVVKRTSSKRNLSAVVTLFFVAPFIAEYLLGDLPLKFIFVLILMAPMYGGGAVLIREAARRMGRGWPTMFVLGMVYALVEEGFISQSLFNPDYLKLHMHLLQPAYLAGLGIGGWWTLLMLNLHTFWSISVSIALVEALFPEERPSVWLGKIGDSVVAALFVLGLAANAAIGFKQNHFVASQLQFLCTGVACILLFAIAIRLRIRGKLSLDNAVPRPWVTGVVVLALSIAFLWTPQRWGWGAVAALLALDAVFLVFLTLFSSRSGWTPLHTLSVAAAGAIAYGFHAFFQPPLVPGSMVMARVGNAIFLAVAVALIVMAARRSAQVELATERG